MHLKSVSAFEVVGKQHCPSHDDKLKIQHGHTETLAGLWSSIHPPKHTSSITPTALMRLQLASMCVPGSVCSGLGECVLACLPHNICYLNLPANNEQLPSERRTTERRMERPSFCCHLLNCCMVTKVLFLLRMGVQGSKGGM